MSEVRQQKAQKLIEDVVEGRKKFGKMYGTGPYSASEILDALLEVWADGEAIHATNKAAQTKLSRQLTAAKAREAKLRKLLKAKEESE